MNDFDFDEKTVGAFSGFPPVTKKSDESEKSDDPFNFENIDLGSVPEPEIQKEEIEINTDEAVGNKDPFAFEAVEENESVASQGGFVDDFDEQTVGVFGNMPVADYSGKTTVADVSQQKPVEVAPEFDDFDEKTVGAFGSLPPVKKQETPVKPNSEIKQPAEIKNAYELRTNTAEVKKESIQNKATTQTKVSKKNLRLGILFLILAISVFYIIPLAIVFAVLSKKFFKRHKEQKQQLQTDKGQIKV
ncbi:MAG: hypothetical protein IJ025_08115 [Clostridia bacterium]|nr:hypothetical protein [Clostridia bacterium]